MTKARAMRIEARLPHNLWKEVVNCAVYLWNRTPRAREDEEGHTSWRSPYELFFSTDLTARKPHLAHLKAYGCKAYAMTPEAQEKRLRLQKLDPRAHIGYLVGYDSTNIYRVWIPHQGKVISTRDVLFDESRTFGGKSGPLAQDLLEDLNMLIQRIQLPEPQVNNEEILDDDDMLAGAPEADQEDDYESVVAFDGQDNQKEDYEQAKALEEALLTPPQSDYEEPDRFDDFDLEEIRTGFHGAFLAGRRFKDWQTKRQTFKNSNQSTHRNWAWLRGWQLKRIQDRPHKRNLPFPPRTMKDLEDHPLRDDFKEAQRAHLDSHRQMESFAEVDKRHARGIQVLGCMWVFTYKTDKHGRLQKCKARLVVLGNQQARSDLPTRTTTLASTAFRELMAITAKFDLKTIQLDAVNAFVNCSLDEVAYMRNAPWLRSEGQSPTVEKGTVRVEKVPVTVAD